MLRTAISKQAGGVKQKVIYCCFSIHAAKLQQIFGIYKDLGNKIKIYLYFSGKMLAIRTKVRSYLRREPTLILLGKGRADGTTNILYFGLQKKSVSQSGR